MFTACCIESEGTKNELCVKDNYTSGFESCATEQIFYLRNMNYLAHILLSGKDDEILIGNFAGDFVKGKRWKDLPEKVGQGVILHRFIDSYADDHDVSMGLKKLLHPVIGKWAGVALDVLYDHILAKQWRLYGIGDLDQFSRSAYQRMQKSRELLPERALPLLEAMSGTNWLLSYADFETIPRVFAAMERRIGGNANLFPAAATYLENEETFDRGFSTFFPDLQRACSQKISSFGRINETS